MIVFEEINNQRSIVICRLFSPWIPLDELTLEESGLTGSVYPYPRIVIHSYYRSKVTPWTSQTPYDFWIGILVDISMEIRRKYL